MAMPMKGGGSDAESSDGDARPLFRPLVKRSTPGTGAVTRRSRHRSMDEVVSAALLNYSSDEDDALPRARHLAALKNLRRSAQENEDGGNGEGKAPRKKTGGNPRANRAKASLNARMQELSDEEAEAAKREPTVEDTMRFLKNMENEEDGEGDDTKRCKRAKRSKPELTRRPLRKGGTTQVLLEDGTKASPEHPGDEATPEKEARLRVRAGQGKGKGKGRANDGGDGLGAESEEEDEGAGREQIQAWADDLAGRIDKKFPDAPATAFSIKPCEPAAIRHLTAASFLGKRKPEEGGHPLIDAEGKINVHFMLGTHKQLQKLRERQQQRGVKADEAHKADVRYLRWLIVKALKLRVINKRELKQGKVNQSRVKNAQATLRWSLSRTSNLADVSDNEGVEDEVTPELKFKGKEKPADFKAISDQNRLQLRMAVANRKTAISATSSHNVDLGDMQDRLLAPSLSFDWEEKDSDDEDNFLEVDIPAEDTHNSKRNMFKEQLHRSASFHQAKGLTHRAGIKSNLSRSFSNLASVLPKGADVASSSKSSSDLATAAASEDELLEKAAISVLWGVLEAEEKPAKVEASQVLSAKSTTTFETEGKSDKAQLPEDVVGQPAASNGHELPADAPQKVEIAASSETTPAQREPNVAEVEPAKVADNPEEFWLQGANTSEALAATETLTTKRPTSLDMSQDDWNGITPTAMWAREMESIDSTMGTEDKENMFPAKASEGTKQLDISPTMPFVPKQAQDRQMEISPTAPFVANVLTEQHVEISPTMPFVANAVPEISPTMPFVPSAEASKGHVEISQTQAFVPSITMHKGSDASAPTIDALGQSSGDSTSGGLGSAANPLGDAGEIPQKKNPQVQGTSETKAEPSRPLQRSAAPNSEDSPSESESDNAGSGEEHGFRPDPKARKREREWLRHKRRAARQEAREAVTEVKRRKVDHLQDLGSSLLSTQEISRFRSEIDNNPVVAKSVSAVPLLKGGDAHDEEREAFGNNFGGALGGIVKKKSFLMK